MPNKRATGSRSTVIRCPNCGEKLEFDLNGLEDEDKPQDEE